MFRFQYQRQRQPQRPMTLRNQLLPPEAEFFRVNRLAAELRGNVFQKSGGLEHGNSPEYLPLVTDAPFCGTEPSRL